MRGLRAVAAMTLVLVALVGCGGRPMPFPIPESEMPPAPGLLTGPSGTYDIPLVKDKPPDTAPAAKSAQP
jgi:hypothetical protein